MAVVAVLLAVVIAFVFYVRPVFISLVLGILVIVFLNTLIKVFRKATQNFSPAKQKAIAVVSTVGVVLFVFVLSFSGVMYLSANFASLLESFSDFVDHYDEIAGDMIEDIIDILEDGHLLITGEYFGEQTDPLELGAANPPPAPPEDPASGANNMSIFRNLDVTNIFQLILLAAGSGIVENATEAITFIGTTIFAAVFIVPIMTLYYFKEKGNVRSKFISLIPDQYKEMADTTIQNIVDDMSAFTAMKILETVIITLLYCVGFYLVGMPHWLFVGVVMGLFNIVPYVGFLLPAIPVVVYSYTLGIEVMLAVIGIIIVIQLFDFFFVLPNVVMKTVQINSFTAVILTLAGLKFAGIFGLIFAVPLYIFCKIILISCYKMLVLMYPDPTDPNEIIMDEG